MTILVAVFGRKDRGKTTTIELLLRILSQQGKKVAVVKHVHNPDFTMDVRGKDSWRFSSAGAKKVVVISPNEAVTMEKEEMPRDPEGLIKKVWDDDYDFIFFEGFSHILKGSGIKKLVVGSNDEDVVDIIRDCSHPLIGIVSPFGGSSIRNDHGLKVYVLPRDAHALLSDIQS